MHPLDIRVDSLEYEYDSVLKLLKKFDWTDNKLGILLSQRYHYCNFWFTFFRAMIIFDEPRVMARSSPRFIAAVPTRVLYNTRYGGRARTPENIVVTSGRDACGGKRARAARDRRRVRPPPPRRENKIYALYYL